MWQRESNKLHPRKPPKSYQLTFQQKLCRVSQKEWHDVIQSDKREKLKPSIV